MAPGDVLDLTRAALILLLTLVGPLLAASLITGVVIGLLQALIFTLLTIIYFSEAVGGEHGATEGATAH